MTDSLAIEDKRLVRSSVTVEFDVPATMCDGVTLRANVYRPNGDGPWPTLLTRTPYGKDDQALMTWLDPVKAARAGFMVVVQDTRGRFASEGEWTPLRFEGKDGHDSVEWAARLPGSSGRVGMFGASYCGNCQWMAALEQPPALAAIAPAQTWSEPLDGVLTRGGAIELGVAVPWTLVTGAGYVAGLQIPEDERQRRLIGLLEDFDRLSGDGYRELSLKNMAGIRRHDVPDIGSIRMLSEPEVASWSRVAGLHERVTAPALNLGGWYDGLLQGTLDNHVAMTELGRASRLIVGPWVHDRRLSDPVGEQCFGVGSSAFGLPIDVHGDIGDIQLAWFGQHLAQEPPSDDETPSQAPVRIFVMGRNEWRDEAAWPPIRARSEEWFLGVGGTLSQDPPASMSPTVEFTYDPVDPVPTVGGHIAMAPAFQQGPVDQAGVEARADVCVFSTEPLQQDLEVTGRVRAVLHVESSAPSTDWVARLCDVHPDGRSFNICDGILRIALGADACRRIEIDLWSTSNVFLAGHRLRVDVTSSSFPRWDRNLNTGNQDESRINVARQRIYVDAQRPSLMQLSTIRTD
jgi:putative CocE/NonD family hydrolase